MALASESELAVLFTRAGEMIPHRQTLIAMGWPQPKDPIQMDNSTAAGVTNKTIVPCRSKMMNMRIFVTQLPHIPRSISILLEFRRQELGRLPHKTPPRHLPRSPFKLACRLLVLDGYLSPSPALSYP
jgi:hypothetical protein